MEQRLFNKEVQAQEKGLYVSPCFSLYFFDKQDVITMSNVDGDNTRPFNPGWFDEDDF